MKHLVIVLTCFVFSCLQQQNQDATLTPALESTNPILPVVESKAISGYYLKSDAVCLDRNKNEKYRKQLSTFELVEIKENGSFDAKVFYNGSSNYLLVDGFFAEKQSSISFENFNINFKTSNVWVSIMPYHSGLFTNIATMSFDLTTVNRSTTTYTDFFKIGQDLYLFGDNLNTLLSRPNEKCYMMYKNISEQDYNFYK